MSLSLGAPLRASLSRTSLRAPQHRARTMCSAAATSQRVKFNDGTSTTFAPMLNGCWQLAGGHGRINPSDFVDAACQHMNAGLTTFDTADIYGPSESILGQFRGAWEGKKPAGAGSPEIFTKYVPNIFQQRPTKTAVENAIKRSLTALRVDSLDLVQLHWWDFQIPGMTDVGLALTDLKKQGLIKSVGVTNMNLKALKELVDAGVPVVCNQVQFSLVDRRPLNGMIQYCKEKDIKLFTYGTVGGGLLSDTYYEEPKAGLLGGKRYTPIDLNTSSLKMFWRSVEMSGGQEVYRELLSALRRVADRHAAEGATIAAVALRWAMDQGPVHPIVGTRSARHIKDNLVALSLKLTKEDHADIDAVLAKMPPPRGDCYSYERGE